MDIEQARFNMIEQQIRPAGVLDPAALAVLREVPREEFVPPALRALAFADLELPLGLGQCMLRPLIEGRLLQAAHLKRSDSVLEIGCGSGYMAALLAARADRVRTLEIEPTLAEQARRSLARLNVDNVLVEDADGTAGWPERAPYDVIVASGAVRVIPEAWLAQLKSGGRVLACVGEGAVQQVQVVTNAGGGYFTTQRLFEAWLPPLRLDLPEPFAL